MDSAQAVPGVNRRALLLLNRTGQLTGAGRNTAANTIMVLPGLTNSLATQQGYKPVSAEGLVVLAPELIIITSATLQASGGLEKFKAIPGVSSTPAALRGHIVVLDDLLILGLGPRVGQVVRQLKEAAK